VFFRRRGDANPSPRATMLSSVALLLLQPVDPNRVPLAAAHNASRDAAPLLLVIRELVRALSREILVLLGVVLVHQQMVHPGSHGCRKSPTPARTTGRRLVAEMSFAQLHDGAVILVGHSPGGACSMGWQPLSQRN
jgi:hypothetical protein